MKSVFRDRHEQLRYAKFVEVARRLRQNPTMVQDARTFVLTHMRVDPHQLVHAERWIAVLEQPVEVIIDRLLADNPEGDLLRDTAPPFGRGFASREVAALIDGLHA